MKKALSVAFAALLMFLLLPLSVQAEEPRQLAPQPAPALAAEDFLSPDATPTGNVAQRMGQVKELFPNGSYFSKSRTSCTGATHDAAGNCSYSQCSLSNVLPTIPGFGSVRLAQASGSLSFARFASFYIFGLSPDKASGFSGYSSVSLSNAKPGDFVWMNNGAHAGIFLSQTATHVYLLDSNNGYVYSTAKTNKVSHRSPTPKSGNTFAVYHPNNYDKINDAAQVSIISLELNVLSVYLEQEQTFQLTAYVYPANTSENKKVTWASSNPSVATVSSTGLVTMRAASGQARITATAGHAQKSCAVYAKVDSSAPLNPPIAPSDLRAVKIDPAGITLEWFDPYDPWKGGSASPAAVYYFEIQRLEGGQWVTKAVVDGGSYLDTDIRAGAQYTYRVRCYYVDKTGPVYSDASNTIAAKLATGWQTEGAKRYYYNSNGVKQIGWVAISGNRYFFDAATGVMQTGWVQDESGIRYCDRSTGAMCTGWLKIDGQQYYFDRTTGVSTWGWVRDGSKWYYLDSTGKRTGWLLYNGERSYNWYYFDKSTGAMRTGWVLDGSRWYFFDNSGAMYTGLLQNDGNRYILDWNTGEMRTGWVQTGDGWYYLNNPNGVARTGWVQDGGTWYFFNRATSVMHTGWLLDGGTWYYLDGSSGAMRTGWLLDGGHWYYLQPSGVMATGTAYIGGVQNRFNAGGVWLGAA